MSPLRKPVVIVTGASKGLGLATTKLLLNKFNAQVVALSRSQPPELLELGSDDLLAIPCDITDDTALTHAIKRAEETFGHIDGLVLNAAIVEPFGSVGSETPVSAWRHHFDVNFFSLVVALKAALSALRRSELGGRVVFVSSGSAVTAMAGTGPYSIGKAAMNMLCRTIAVEEPKIVAVALRPGMVDTDMQTTIRSNPGAVLSEKDHRKFSDAYNEGKLVKPEVAGHVIAALALKAEPTLSGQFVSWDSDQCEAYRAK